MVCRWINKRKVAIFMTKIRPYFDMELNELHQDLLRMGTIVEQQICEAVGSLVKKDKDMAEKVIKRDEEIDKLQLLIEDKCVKLIIKWQPIAKDIRTIFVAIKLTTDLERISDKAVDIAEIAIELLDEKYIKPLVDIPRMADITKKMVKTALDSYVKQDIEMAKGLSDMEKEIDNLYSQVFRELLLLMISNPKTISQATHLLFIARHLERIGDHSTNIGEMVIYLETGKRVSLNE